MIHTTLPKTKGLILQGKKTQKSWCNALVIMGFTGCTMCDNIESVSENC